MSKHMFRLKFMRKLENQNIRKVQKSHGVFFLSIPVEIARKMKLRRKQKMIVDYEEQGKRIVIKDWKRKAKKK